MTGSLQTALDRFASDYAAHRAAEGRRHDREELLRLPWLETGPFARQWAVRARTFETFVARVVDPMTRRAARPLRILDLGAGSGWLCHRLVRRGHECVAVDIREDSVDGLGAAEAFVDHARFERLVAPFDVLPVSGSFADIALFNAALHYATDLGAALTEAARVTRSGGTIAVLDSPFYRDEAEGEAMVAEKHARAAERFGERADSLLALPFIEYLTADRLARASAPLGLQWRRRRVRYPLWYELRPLAARWRRQRVPSRFDLWTAEVP